MRLSLSAHRGKPMKRVPDLIDVWFDSGAMPYAQWHFPFENSKGKATFKQNLPGRFYCGRSGPDPWLVLYPACIACLVFDSV